MLINKPARNMFAYEKNGSELWQAEDIAQGATDAYTNVLSESPFKVGNFAGFTVNVDLSTGKVTCRVYKISPNKKINMDGQKRGKNEKNRFNIYITNI